MKDNLQIVDREDITEDIYAEMLEMEEHHEHLIVRDSNGVYRWVEDERTRQLADKIGINEIVSLFYALGHDKNSEIYRQFYRNLGYSLYGYWEVFYWEVNNDDAHLYNPPIAADAGITPINPREIIDISLQLEELSSKLNLIGLNARPETKLPDTKPKWLEEFADKFCQEWERLSEEEGNKIIQQIDEDNIPAYSIGSSLHVSESRYKIEDEEYRVFTYIGYSGHDVERKKK